MKPRTRPILSTGALAALLSPKAPATPESITQDRINEAMNRIGTVHFARFVIRPVQMELMVITNYDNSFAEYIGAFTNAIGEIFDQLLSHTEDGGHLVPVKQHQQEFLAYVQSHDASFDPVAKEPFSSYCAYPRLKVLDILNLARNAGLEP
jgi:hypothetical protein